MGSDASKEQAPATTEIMASWKPVSRFNNGQF
jgi:hypothetical protein